MRSWVIAIAIVIILLASSAIALGSGPWVADFPSADRSPYQDAGALQRTLPEPAVTSGGLVSVDFLGQIRKQLDVGHLISLFPFTWFGSSRNQAMEKVKFMGFSYERTSATPPAGEYYYTGEQDGDRRIYVSASERKGSVVPGHVYLKEDDRYTAYAISDMPEVYAYVLCSALNANETVRFGIANDGQDDVKLPNAAPYEVLREENGAWRTVYSAIAAQVITPLSGGSRLAWQWDQQLDDGSLAPEGDYHVVIAGKYVAPFRIDGDVPIVEMRDSEIDRAVVDELAASCTAIDAYRTGTKEDTVSIMQYKAWAMGLDPEQLHRAIVAAGDGLPCMAIHASYEGRPAWIILFSPRSDLSAPDIHVVDDATGKLV